MPPMIWSPKVTVAAVIERQGRFLVVEETTDCGIRINQPAGHLDEGEDLAAAVVRETAEETAHTFLPEALIGVYLWRVPPQGPTYLRFCFCGPCTDFDPKRTLDKEILRTLWLTRDELCAEASRLRSPLVLACIDDYLQGQRHPLELLHSLASGG